MTAFFAEGSHLSDLRMASLFVLGRIWLFPFLEESRHSSLHQLMEEMIVPKSQIKASRLGVLGVVAWACGISSR